MSEQLFDKYPSPIEKKLDNFEKYVKRQALTRFIARYELFKKVIEIKGSIVECGVHHGGGLFAWAKLSAGIEPVALDRKIIGFDTFEGFPSVHSADKGVENAALKTGGFSTGYNVLSELEECKSEFDNNRFLNQFEKIEFVKGDACKTIPDYVKSNPHLIVSLLFLDFDLYEPTAVALEHLLPRIPKGGIVAFDEINNPWWPGETTAALEAFKSFNKVQLSRFSFDPNIAYAVM